MIYSLYSKLFTPYSFVFLFFQKIQKTSSDYWGKGVSILIIGGANKGCPPESTPMLAALVLNLSFHKERSPVQFLTIIGRNILNAT